MEKAVKVPVLLVSMALLFFPHAVLGAAEPFFRLAGDSPAHRAQLDLAGLPANASNVREVIFSGLSRLPLDAGSGLGIQLGENETYEIELVQYTEFVNGDRAWSGDSSTTDRPVSLSMTFGATLGFGDISVAGAEYSLRALKQFEGNAGHYIGWLYQSPVPAASPPDSGAFSGDSPEATDIIRSTGAALVRARVGKRARSAGPAGVLEVGQEAAKSSYQLGDRLKTTVAVRNTGEEDLSEARVRIYLVGYRHQPYTPQDDNPGLEIVDLPSECETGRRFRDAIELVCVMAELKASEKRSLQYSVRTVSELSAGKFNLLSYMISQVVVEETIMDTYWIPLTIDVLKDSDGDGISDFNEDILGTDPRDSLSTYEDDVIIDVLVFYTAGMVHLSANAPETFINQIFNRANRTFARSSAGIVVRPVAKVLVDYAEHFTNLDVTSAMMGGKAPFEDIARLRARYGADLVTLFRGYYEGNSSCGIAYMPSQESRGHLLPFREYSFISALYSDNCRTALAHELGHNFGLVHSRRQDPGGGTFPFSAGYGVDGLFVTVMAYWSAFNANRIEERFSSPSYLCQGEVCGVDPSSDPEQGADAVTTLRTVRFQVASYYQSRPLLALNAKSGKSVDAEVRGGVIAKRRNGDGTFGGSYDNYFNDSYATGDLLDLALTISSDPAHVGKAANLHTVIHASGRGFYQLNPEGEYVPWDGRVGSLTSASGEIKLSENLDFEFFSDFAFESMKTLQSDGSKTLAEIEDGNIRIFIGYSLRDEPELVYTREPILFHIDYDRSSRD